MRSSPVSSPSPCARSRTRRWCTGWGIRYSLAQAEGSLIERDGKTIGSELIAQPFASEKVLLATPTSRRALPGYAADAASGSNLGTTNPALRDRIGLDAARQVASRTSDVELKTSLDRLDGLQAELKSKKEIKEPTQADTDTIAKIEGDVATTQARALDRASDLGKSSGTRVPVDLVTTSGAGLDPHISPEAARYQAPAWPHARGLASGSKVEDMIDAAHRSIGRMDEAHHPAGQRAAAEPRPGQDPAATPPRPHRPRRAPTAAPAAGGERPAATDAGRGGPTAAAARGPVTGRVDQAPGEG